MRRRKLPSFKDNAKKHHKRTDAFVEALTRDLREKSIDSTLQLLQLVPYDGSGELSFADYPQVKQAVQRVRQTYAQRLRLGVSSAVIREWELAENQINEFTHQALSLFSLERGGRYEGYFPKNKGALQAFVKRREEGLKLSDKIWDLSGEHMDSLERAISTAVHDGWSAATLSKRVSQYLKDYPKLKQDYGLRYGKAIDVQDCEYKSARLARTEINMAYRESERERWAGLDFVVGYEIKRSEREYGCPVCQALAGKYPKDFRWAGWHPNCRCYSIPILSTDDEFWASSAEHPLSSSVNEVKDTPENFKVWLSENAQRNEQAKARGTQPYFLRDNPKYTTNKSTEALSLFKRYPDSEWDKTAIYQDKGGYVVTHRERIAEGKRNSRERAIFDKELEMCNVCAMNGNKVEYLSSANRKKGETYDIRFNGEPAELKSFSGAGAMIRQLKHALKEQGAEIVVVELVGDIDNRLYTKLLEARRKIEGIMYFYKSETPEVFTELKK